MAPLTDEESARLHRRFARLSGAREDGFLWTENDEREWLELRSVLKQRHGVGSCDRDAQHVGDGDRVGG